MNDIQILNVAIEITKSFGHGGFDKMRPDDILDCVFKKLKELKQEIEKG